MKNKLFLLFFAPLLFFNSADPQNKGKADYSEQADMIRKANTLFYYGVDFSHVRVSDGEKVSRNKVYCEAYPPAWIAWVQNEMSPTGYVKKALKKEVFYYKQEEIYPVSIKVFHDFMMSPAYKFSADTVKFALKQYNLTEKSGIGLVLIPENFNKKQEMAMTWIVFFDIESREILWATKFSGHCGGMGYTAHWGSGVVNGFKAFIRDLY